MADPVDPPAPALSPVVMPPVDGESAAVEIDWVGQQLRAMYATVVAEPLPESLRALLQALDSEPGS